MTSETGATMRLERVIHAPVERVFRAFVDPEQAVRWWGPPDVRTSLVEIDLRVGGACRWVMHPGEVTAVLHGRIVALEAPHLLVMTNRWEGQVADSIVTLRFQPVPEGTRIELTHAAIDPRDGVAAYEQGWAAFFDSLDRYMAQPQSVPAE